MAKQRPKSSEEDGGPRRHEILLTHEAAEDLKGFRAFEQRQIRDAVEQHLRHQPTRTSRARIKRLRGLKRPRYRLRVSDDIRVFYDVTAEVVLVLAILNKAEVNQWLETWGEAE